MTPLKVLSTVIVGLSAVIVFMVLWAFQPDDDGPHPGHTSPYVTK